MKKTMVKKFHIFICALVAPLLWSCQDKMESYYEEPNWLKGSIYEILENDGNYSIFLKGVDMCDYTSIMKGKSILTVMAPNDSAFTAYLKENYNTGNIGDLSTSEVKKLIGFHILYYSFDKDKLVNFRPNEGDGASSDEQDVNAGLYYKFRTKSQDAVSNTFTHRVWNSTTMTVDYDTIGQNVDVYHLERFLPIFSYRMFETKLIDAAYNYEYFFPKTDWTGDEGFNVANAEVTDYEKIAKNGYIYFVDRVIKPLETIHSELANNSNYSMYLNLYDQYDYYIYDEDLTSTYGGGTSTYYQHKYLGSAFTLPNIDSEWPVSTYTSMSLLSSVAYSVFAPTNEAFNEFYQSYWGLEGTGYPSEVSYDSISTEAIQYLLSNSVYTSSIVFPEEISNGDVKNEFTGTAITFPVDEVPEENRKMCVNGVLYGCSELTPPAVFGSVTGPAYQYKGFSNFLTMLTNSDLTSTLCSDAVNFIMLYPSNTQMAAHSITYNNETNKLMVGTANMGSSTQQAYVYTHVVSLDDGNTELPTTGTHVYRSLSSNYKLYWYVKDGKITNSFRYNDLIHYTGNTTTTKDSVYYNIEELLFRGEAWSNGSCYQYDTDNNKALLEGNLSNAIYGNFIPMAYAHRNDANTLFGGFIKVLGLADMIDEESQTITLMTEDCLMLVPTTDAIKTAILNGSFPYITTTSTDVDDEMFFDNCVVDESNLTNLQHYLCEYFIPESTAPMSNYPYVGWGEDTESEGGLPSIADMSTTPATNVLIQIYDNGSKLSAKVNGMNTAVDFYGEYDYLPFVFEDGCVQFMNGIFENKWPL